VTTTLRNARSETKEQKLMKSGKVSKLGMITIDKGLEISMDQAEKIIENVFNMCFI